MTSGRQTLWSAAGSVVGLSRLINDNAFSHLTWQPKLHFTLSKTQLLLVVKNLPITDATVAASVAGAGTGRTAARGLAFGAV